MSFYITVQPRALSMIKAIIIALAAFSLWMLFAGNGSNALLWALSLSSVILLKFLRPDAATAPVAHKSPGQLHNERQGRQAVAYIVSIAAIVVPGYWLLSVAMSPETIGFPVLPSFFLVPIIITGLVGLRNLIKQSRRSNNPQTGLSGQVLNGLIIGIIGAVILLLIIGNLSF
jgi:hypothetical protein